MSPRLRYKRKYKMEKWSVQQIVRADGRVEDICKHGVGHPNIHYLGDLEDQGKLTHQGIHGCDGCCEHIKPLPLNTITTLH